MKLSNVQKHKIQTLLTEGKASADIAKELDIPEKTVVTYLNDMFKTIERIKKEQRSAETKAKVDDGIVRKTKTGKDGVAIMTESGSARGDDFREAEKRVNTKEDFKEKSKDYIFRPKDTKNG